MVKPNEVIVSHVNEMAKRDGKVLPGTRTAAFIETTNVPVRVLLSGRTMDSITRPDARQGAEVESIEIGQARNFCF